MVSKRVRCPQIASVALGSLFLVALPNTLAASEQQPDRSISLSEAITLALHQNRDLKLARLGILESRAKKAEAHANYFPKISNESKITHVTELAGVQIPAGAFGHYPSTGPIPAETLFLGQGGATSYTSGTGLTQPLTQLFKIKNVNRAAEADLQTSQIDLIAMQDSIALKVRQLYFSTLIAREQRDAAQVQINAAQTKDEETKQAIAQGRALEADGLQSRTALLEATQALLTQQIKLRDLSLALNDLLGLPLDTHVTLEDLPDAFQIPLPPKQEAIQRLLSDSSRVKAARQALIKAQAADAAALDNYIPDVTALARYSYQSGIPFLVHNFGTFGFAVTYDIFDGGKRKAEHDRSTARLRQAEVNLEKVMEEARIELDQAFNKVEQLSGLVTVAQEAFQARQELTRVTTEQFVRDAALASSRDEALAKQHQAKASLLEAMLGRSLAEADVLRILGEH